MRVEVHRETRVGVVLDEEEAKWLLGVMQNPLHGNTNDDEPPEDFQMRQRFWKSLSEKLGR